MITTSGAFVTFSFLAWYALGFFILGVVATLGIILKFRKKKK